GTTKVAGTDRYRAQRLVLNPEAVLEIVLAGDVGIRTAQQDRQAERAVVGRTDFAVLREVVAVQIVPGACVRLQLQRIVALSKTKRLTGHVLVDGAFDGRPSVPERIVGHAEPWRDVEPARHAAGFRE